LRTSCSSAPAFFNVAIANLPSTSIDCTLSLAVLFCLSIAAVSLSPSEAVLKYSWPNVINLSANKPTTTNTAPTPVAVNAAENALAPACNSTLYYRLQQTCSGSVTSSFSATGSFYNDCPPEYYYYAVRKYQCQVPETCVFIADQVARSEDIMSTTDGLYWKLGLYVYQVQTEITPAPASWDVDLTGTLGDMNCIVACEL